MNNDKLQAEHARMRDALEKIRTLWNQNAWDSVSAKIASEALHCLEQPPVSRAKRVATIAAGMLVAVASLYGIAYLSTVHSGGWWAVPTCLMLFFSTVVGALFAIFGWTE